MSPQPLFSITVPTHSRPDQLGACVEALAGLEYPRDGFEVIVVDDGSATPLEAVVESVRDRIAITLLTQQRAGPAAARNAGAAHARGRYLVFTDDDCAPEPDWLTALEARFRRTPQHAIGGRTLNALPGNAYAACSQLLTDYLHAHHAANGTAFFTSNNLALPADAFRALGGFDTSFPRPGGEDRDLCAHWSERGYRVDYAPEVRVHHDHAMTFPAFVRQHFNYGRGAFLHHRARAGRAQAPPRREPGSFYRAMLRYALSHPTTARARPGRQAALAMLLMASQLANALGFWWERRASRGRRPPPDPARGRLLGPGLYALSRYGRLPLRLTRLFAESWRTPTYRQRVREMLACVPAATTPCTWIHLRGLGEVKSIEPLLEMALERHPERPIWLTLQALDPTVYAHVQGRWKDTGRVRLTYVPHDISWIVERFIGRAKPRIGVFLETPFPVENRMALISGLRARGIPVVLANARISPSAVAGLGGRSREAMANLLASVSVAAQSSGDALRYEALGAAQERCHVVGNTKFDLPAVREREAQAATSLREAWRGRPVWIAASTHSPEEFWVLDAYAELREAHPELLLILVPRFPRDGDAIARLIGERGLSAVRRSTGDPVTAQTHVLLGDTLGELPVLYGASDVAFVGGTLAPVGGHNVLEPLASGTPVIVGPHTLNFENVVAPLLEAEAIVRIAGAKELASAVAAILSSPQRAGAMVAAGNRVLEGSRGAVGRLFDLLEARAAD